MSGTIFLVKISGETGEFLGGQRDVFANQPSHHPEGGKAAISGGSYQGGFFGRPSGQVDIHGPNDRSCGERGAAVTFQKIAMATNKTGTFTNDGGFL